MAVGEEWPTWTDVKFDDVVEIQAGESLIAARLGVQSARANLSTSAKREMYRDIILFSVPEPLDLNTAALLGESILLLGTNETVKAAIDRRLAKSQFPVEKLEEIRRISSIGQLWAVTNDTSRGLAIAGARSYSAAMNQSQEGNIEVEIAARFDSPTAAQAFVRDISDDDLKDAALQVSGASVRITFKTTSLDVAENIFAIPMFALLDDTQ